MIDWSGLITLGLSKLRIPPDVFWNLTPKELLLIAGVENQANRLFLKSNLDRLCEMYPDEKDKNV